MNYIEQYYKEIQNGLPVSQEIKDTYEHLYKKLSDTSDGFLYDETKANRIIEFAENFIVMPKSKSKETVKLLLWEKAMFQAIFGFVDNFGNRQYHEAFLEVGRKNGKSSIGSIIALYLLIADNERQPEIYTAANKLDQSKIVWRSGIDMINATPELKELCKVRVGSVSTPFNGGIFKPLANDKKGFDGLNANLIILDECHQYQDDDLYNVLVDSQAMREQPLTLLTTTNGFVRDKFLDKKLEEYRKIINGYKDKSYIDNRRIAFIYKLDNENEMYDENCWIKSNPSIDVIRSREMLRADIERSKQDEQKKKDVLTKFFNLPQTGNFNYLSVEECSNKSTFDIDELKPRYYIGGFDLSKVNDVTSAVALFKVPNDETFYLENMNWMPSELLEEHIRKDKIPYDIFVKRGWLRLCNGNQIDYKDVVLWFEEIRNNYDLYPYRIGYDAWSSNYIVTEMKKLYGKDTLMAVHQGAKSLSLPLQHLKALLQNKQINYNNNQLFKMFLLNLQVQIDSNGNLNTFKNRNLNIRDDGACALLNALYVYLNEMENYNNLISY
jgi:phage terminase large subunit-like protein